MAQYRILTLAALGGALALAACGSANEAPADKPAASGGQATSGGVPANWKATDACSILDKATVAEILKRDVSETGLSLVHEPGTAEAGTSECTYSGPDGNVASLSARWSPINDNTAETIAAARSTSEATLKAFGKTLEDVPGLGKAAFFAPGIDQLTVFIDDARMIVVTAQKVPDGAAGKDVAIALAKKAGA
ncbi:hypothetical protein WG901_09305 [Novosphingobium sp. PS1R-30]|uniref:DUF3558 domain-containing protein n=1 Tax=Novosphingobium anseongense TaxID=3133436 RepID=A0ABU8RUQ4_9SPHN|nr:MAG: hypothetical protein EOO76_07370 [Novosphingobium sp.]